MNLLGDFGPTNLTAGYINAPAADSGNLPGPIQKRLAGFQSRFSRLTRGDVGTDGHKALGKAVVTNKRGNDVVDPIQLSRFGAVAHISTP